MNETTTAAAKLSLPIGVQAAKIFGMPINDLATYLAILVSIMVACDYLWKWYRRWNGIKKGGGK